MESPRSTWLRGCAAFGPDQGRENRPGYVRQQADGASLRADNALRPSVSSGQAGCIARVVRVGLAGKIVVVMTLQEKGTPLKTIQTAGGPAAAGTIGHEPDRRQ